MCGLWAHSPVEGMQEAVDQCLSLIRCFYVSIVLHSSLSKYMVLLFLIALVLKVRVLRFAENQLAQKANSTGRNVARSFDCNLVIPLCDKYLLSAYYIPGIVIGTGKL